VHPAWSAYPDTILHFPEVDREVDLRRPLPPDARSAFGDLGLSGSSAVVTAHNPLGLTLSETSNRRLETLLAALVRTRYPGARPAHGRPAYGRHLERGWAIPIPLEEAEMLAARFFRNALFWYDGDRFFIVPVLASGPPLPLPDRMRS